MSLNEWLKNKAALPLFILLLILLSLQFYNIYNSIFEHQALQHSRVQRLVKTLELAYVHQSVSLIENLIQSSFIEIKPDFLGICYINRIEIGNPADIKECPQTKNSFFSLIISKKILGTDGRNLIIKYSKIPPNVTLDWRFIYFLVSILSFIFIIFRLIINLKKDIIKPLLNDIFEDKVIQISEIELLRKANLEMSNIKRDRAVLAAKNLLSQQVAHDIKSPVGTLFVALENLHLKSEKSIKLIRSATSRIQAIAMDLDKSNDELKIINPLSPQNLKIVLEEILYEKKIEFPTVIFNFHSIQSDHYYSKISDNEFKRVISNMINNSIEAIDNDIKRITVKIYREDKNNIIEVKDNGTGIPKSIVNKIFNLGFTHGKVSGKGLGLSYSYNKIVEWDGTLRIIKSNHSGTIFHISLPQY
jgi:signal transduction histidine kinase